MHKADDYTLIFHRPELSSEVLPELPDMFDMGRQQDFDTLRVYANDAENRGVEVELSTSDCQKPRYTGRALICTCMGGRALSITVRGRIVADDPATPLSSLPPASDYQLMPTDTKCKISYAASTKTDISPISIASITDLLASLIFDPDRLPAQGLIVVSGSTASAKSQVARGLIHKYLSEPSLLGKPDIRKRRPHLVTVEDPIETWLVEEPSRYHASAVGVDYTPREIGIDVASLSEAIREAKRQTPAVFFVGETRTPRDWELLLNFAGSGHLVVTTTHAESLVVTLGNMLLDAQSPSDRGAVASRILAMVHQKAITPSTGKTVVLPTLWRRTAQGIAEIISDGRAAIVPNNPHSLVPPVTYREAGTVSCIGRAWFAERLLAEADPKHRAAVILAARSNDISGE